MFNDMDQTRYTSYCTVALEQNKTKQNKKKNRGGGGGGGGGGGQEAYDPLTRCHSGIKIRSLK